MQEIEQKIELLHNQLKSMQLQLQSQKFLIHALVENTSDIESIADRYQQLLDNYEQTTTKQIPNLLVSC